MVKKFTANCSFSGEIVPVTLYVGNPSKGTHPLSFQSNWLSKERGGKIPANIMDSFAKLADIAEKNKVPFEDLCSYVIDEVQASNSIEEEGKKANKFSKEGDDEK